MYRKPVGVLLDKVRGIRHACDLDLLGFFYRHPCALLTSEQLVAYVGYDRDRIGQSLDGLLEAGLLTRLQNPSHAARLYRLELGAESGGWLESLLQLAATRQGRKDVLQLLEDGSPRAPAARLRRRLGVARVA